MQTVLITGAGRETGLGFETARQLGQKGYHVILAARRESQLQPLVERLKSEGASASYVVLDITSEDSAREAAGQIEREFGRLDVLVNNAALMIGGQPVDEVPVDELRRIFDTNVIGTFNVTQKMLPLLRKSSHARIVNVSSGAGSYGDPQYGFLHGKLGMTTLGYGMSKLAENGMTIKLAQALAQEHILVNSVCPDVTNTQGAGFGRPVQESAKSVVWAVELPEDSPTGGFYRDGKALPW